MPHDTNEEFFTLEELEKVFSLEGISKSPSVFDYEKLLWFNNNYIKKLSLEKFMEMAKPYYNDELKAFADDKKLAAMVQTRISTFPEVNEKAAFVCGLPEYDTELFVNKKNKTTLEMAKDVLEAAIPVIEGIESFDNDTLFAELKAFAEAKELKAGAVMWIIRIGVSGMSVTPGGATELMAVLGKEESISRLKKSLAKLS